MQAQGGSHPHRIVRHGPDRMVLSCSRSGGAVIEATRAKGNTTWTLVAHDSDAPDRVIDTEQTRADAVDAMIAFAMEVTAHEGMEINLPPRQAHPHEEAHSPHVWYREIADPTGTPRTVAMIHLRDEP